MQILICMGIVMVTVFKGLESLERFLDRCFIAWPPRPPDLNPLDSFLWGQLKHSEQLFFSFSHLFFQLSIF
jgi:hypothetical protein